MSVERSDLTGLVRGNLSGLSGELSWFYLMLAVLFAGLYAGVAGPDEPGSLTTISSTWPSSIAVSRAQAGDYPASTWRRSRPPVFRLR